MTPSACCMRWEGQVTYLAWAGMPDDMAANPDSTFRNSAAS